MSKLSNGMMHGMGMPCVNSSTRELTKTSTVHFLEKWGNYVFYHAYRQSRHKAQDSPNGTFSVYARHTPICSAYQLGITLMYVRRGYRQRNHKTFRVEKEIDKSVTIGWIKELMNCGVACTRRICCAHAAHAACMRPADDQMHHIQMLA
jgi:hypothetical protein